MKKKSKEMRERRKISKRQKETKQKDEMKGQFVRNPRETRGW